MILQHVQSTSLLIKLTSRMTTNLYSLHCKKNSSSWQKKIRPAGVSIAQFLFVIVWCVTKFLSSGWRRKSRPVSTNFFSSSSLCQADEENLVLLWCLYRLILFRQASCAPGWRRKSGPAVVSLSMIFFFVKHLVPGWRRNLVLLWCLNWRYFLSSISLSSGLRTEFALSGDKFSSVRERLFTTTKTAR